MGKLANLAGGFAGGFMQGKRAKKADDRAETMDQAYATIIEQMGAKKSSQPVENAVVTADTKGATSTSDPNEESVVSAFKDGGMIGYSEGGTVGELPMGCRMAWQRQSFKKKQ